jgi:hypothetical protein
MSVIDSMTMSAPAPEPVGWQSKSDSFNQSEMALFYDCMLQCARKLLDTADIVREAILE